MSTTDAKAYKGLGMEGRVAKWYAANTGKNLNEFTALARRVASELRPGDRVLEVAPGPGYFAIELAKLGSFRIDGLDISKTFVEIANRNAKNADVQIDFQQGDAAHLPFESETIDFILCRAAFKNFAEPMRALQEMRRVLKSGGKGLLIDLRKDAAPNEIRQVVDGMNMSAVNKIVTRLTFRFMLLKRAYTESQFRDFFSQANFTKVDFAKSPTGFEIRFER